ncbi:MAG: sigma factor, partial [Nitrospinaceae bacterium]
MNDKIPDPDFEDNGGDIDPAAAEELAEVREPEVLDPEEPDAGDSLPAPALPVPSTDKSLAPLDPMAAYLNEIRQYGEMSEEEEQQLARQFQETGDPKAAYRLITHNLTLVVKIAMTYRREWENMMDLIQEGNVGLMKAVQHFDPFR